ncbi:hypothetical protein [Nitrospirillum iridis]|uniref:Lipoprotein n=1 Tax=Nitrospirillum iridis TaxID=765888 RepID=A0A7X0AUS3_9PROT|nr:hypothetical protein [Nitrospirillum iridis]MBB6249686.1 hypothetical protein [Nitrospirillum iridis]
MKNYLLLAATTCAVLAAAGCQTTPDASQTANAAAKPAGQAAPRNCVNTGSRLSGTCYAGGQADPKDLLNRPLGTKVPGS